MQDRFRFRAWYTSISREEEPHYVYDIEQLYDGYVNSGRHELAWVSSFGSLLDSPEEYIIEQCTGLKDKKGKLIYEGDIVKQEGGMKERLIPVCWCGTAYNIPLIEYYNDGKVHEVFEFTYEIVGNKHQNPQLWYALGVA